MGGRQFYMWEVRDLVQSPAQLMAMRKRGYLNKIRIEITPFENNKRKFPVAVYQMTDQARVLAEIYYQAR